MVEAARLAAGCASEATAPVDADSDADADTSFSQTSHVHFDVDLTLSAQEIADRVTPFSSQDRAHDDIERSFPVGAVVCPEHPIDVGGDDFVVIVFASPFDDYGGNTGSYTIEVDAGSITSMGLVEYP